MSSFVAAITADSPHYSPHMSWFCFGARSGDVPVFKVTAVGVAEVPVFEALDGIQRHEFLVGIGLAWIGIC